MANQKLFLNGTISASLMKVLFPVEFLDRVQDKVMYYYGSTDIRENIGLYNRLCKKLAKAIEHKL